MATKAEEDPIGRGTHTARAKAEGSTRRAREEKKAAGEERRHCGETIR